MTGVSVLSRVWEPVRTGVADSPLRFVEGQPRPGAWRGRRYLAVGDQNAFELSYWCGTCPFLFRRLEGANGTLSVEGFADLLTAGLDGDGRQLAELVAPLLPEGQYLPLLVELTPRLVYPAAAGDYFAEEQVRTWGIDGFWGLPNSPQVPYYRTGTRPLGPTAALFEFVVPMVPPSWNEPGRVAEHAAALSRGPIPACLAVSVLDTCQPAVAGPGATDPHLQHWALAHFLLDGHHRIHAAAQTGRPTRLLSLLSVDAGIASRDNAMTIPNILTHR